VFAFLGELLVLKPLGVTAIHVGADMLYNVGWRVSGGMPLLSNSPHTVTLSVALSTAR
jgi:hypothetical protein